MTTLNETGKAAAASEYGSGFQPFDAFVGRFHGPLAHAGMEQAVGPELWSLSFDPKPIVSLMSPCSTN
jgi:hypothetical protein